MFKKFAVRLLGSLAFLSVLIFASCSDSLNDKNDVLLGMLAASNSKALQYGSLTINSGDSRALNVSDISYVYASVSGTGIESPVTAKSETITDGSGRGSITITGIPVGKNRVVTVYAYDSSNQKLGTVMIRTVTDIEVGNKNSVTVNQSTTLLGNVFAELLAKGVNLASVDKSAVQSKLSDATKSWALYAASAIASDYVSASSAGGIKTITNYELKTGSITFTNYYDGCTIQVGDPVSSIKSSVSAGEGSLSGIAPGTWPVYVIVSGETVKKTFVTVNAGADTNIGILGTVTDRIIVHCPVSSGYTKIYAWVDSNTELFGTWPGKAMTDSDGDGWYDVEIAKTSCNLIFNGSGQTGDLSCEAGEWWYKDGTWYEANPDDSEAPVLVSFTADKSGTVSGNVVLTVEATDNLCLSKAVITLDGAALTTLNLSGKTSSITYTWETAYITNGSHVIKAVVYDTANNVSSEKTLSFTTSNANLPPVAVISGAGTAAASAEKTYKATDSYDQNGGTISAYEWTVTGATVTSGAGTDTIVVTMPSTEGTSVSIKLRVKDNDNEWSEYVTKPVTVRNQDSDWDFRDETIYFLMTTRFYDGDTGNNVYCWDEGGEYLPYGDGDCAWRGDFKGLIQKLDYIKALGFTSIWITPVVVNASGIDYHGYHAFDFSHVDPRYASGSAVYDASGDDISGDQAYQELIDAVHDKGMKIIQDIVLNHTGNWGEKNINHIFDKATSSVVDSNGYKRAPVMVANEDSPIMKRAAAYYGYDSYASAYAAAQNGVEHDSNPADYAVRLIALKNDEGDSDHFYHHEQMINWNSELTQLGSMAGDCVDLNTENPVVAKYLRDCYIKYINMGVDAFRIDTVKHISRLTFNKEFNEQFMAAGGDKFFMFGETCARYRGRWNEGVPALSPSFYTWKESSDFAWSTSDYTVNKASASSHFTTYASGFAHPAWADGIANHLLNGNNYHTPDYSMRSYLDQIDFPMHWAFASATDAFSTAVNTNDPDFNDATWNVVYVDSHDYAPDNAPESQRYAKTTEWPRNMNLMFTFRGIPCIYYGSEIEFKSGCPIDPANARCQLNLSGRAYFGDEIEGTVTASDFGEYTASGTVATTLSHPLAQHVRRLNKIRAAIPALRKGQYSTEGCSGSIAFKRRYTTSDLDSFVLVAIGGQATFTGIPSGNYVEVITGNTVSSSGSLTSDSIGQDNMRVYVLKTSSCEITGKIGEDGEYLK